MEKDVLTFKNDVNGEEQTLCLDTRGYLMWNGYLSRKPEKALKKMLYVHVLVCKLFHGDKPSERHVPDHIDENKKNNEAPNLEWVTYSENSRRVIANGNTKRPSGKARRVSAFDKKTGKFEKTYKSIAEATRHTKCNSTGIQLCCQGKIKSSHGFRWEYAD